VIDTVTNTYITNIPVGDDHQGVAITPDGTRAYVTNFGPSVVLVIDTASNTTVGPPVPVGFGPTAIAVTPDGTRAYVANFGSDNVSVIDTANNTVVATIMVGDGPRAVAISPPPPPSNVPTLSEWGLITMAGILGIVGFMVLRRKKVTA